MRFGKQKEAEIVKALANKSQYQVGLDYKFDKVYGSPNKVRNAVKHIYQKVTSNPEQYESYGITQEVLDIISQGMEERRFSNQTGEKALVEKKEDTRDIKELLSDIRSKSFRLIDKKLDGISTNKKKLEKVSFKDLGVIAGISFDKTQILKGEATENIAVHAKVRKDMSPDEALEVALTMREKLIEDKNK